jgi:hypothetical protein
LAGIPYYPKLVVAVPFTPATGWRVLVRPGEDRAALTKALASRTARWAEGAGLTGVHVLFPSRDESAWWDEAGYATRLDVQYHWHRREDATWEDFLARFPSKRRRALRHEDDHVAGEGITVETLTADELTPAMAREMYALHAGHVDRFACGRRYLTPRFFELVAERMPERLVWVVARKEGRIVAGAFDVQGGRVLYGRYWGAFERVSFLHFAVCYYHGVRHCLARGLDAFEPGAGGEHKRVRGFDPTLTASNHWIVHPGLRRGVERFLEVERRAVLGWMEEASVARHASG